MPHGNPNTVAHAAIRFNLPANVSQHIRKEELSRTVNLAAADLRGFITYDVSASVKLKQIAIDPSVLGIGGLTATVIASSEGTPCVNAIPIDSKPYVTHPDFQCVLNPDARGRANKGRITFIAEKTDTQTAVDITFVFIIEYLQLGNSYDMIYVPELDGIVDLSDGNVLFKKGEFIKARNLLEVL